MNKYLFKILLSALIIINVTACKKNNEVIDNGVTTPPAFAKFGTSGSGDSTVGSYAVQDIAGDNFKIPIGITTVSNVDRTIQLTVTSTSAQAGVNYNMPTIVTIPAGKSVDSLTVEGIFSSYADGHRDTLYIEITGGDVPVNAYNYKYTLIMFRYCAYSVDNISGDMEVITDEWNDYAPGDIITVNKIDETHVSFEYAAADAQPIVITINPDTKKTSVAKQQYGNYGVEYGNFSAESVSGNNDNYVDPCDHVISVRLNHTTDIGDDYGDYTITLKKVE